MTISYSVSNEINYNLVGIGALDPLSSFPSIYGNYNFEYTVTFSSPYTITNVSVLSSPSYTTETVLSSNTIRIVKNNDNQIFDNESYVFSKFDEEYNKNIEVYLPNQVNDADLNTSVFKWETPTQQLITSVYSFNITYINSDTFLTETEIKTYSQDLIWSQFPGIQILESLVDRSKY